METYFLTKHSNISNNLEVLQTVDCAQDITNGKCVKVELQGKRKISHYAAICQSSIDAEDEVKVAFLKKVGDSKSRFTVNEGDIAFVNKEQIKIILPDPELECRGDRIYYKFEMDINVD